MSNKMDKSNKTPTITNKKITALAMPIKLENDADTNMKPPRKRTADESEEEDIAFVSSTFGKCRGMPVRRRSMPAQSSCSHGISAPMETRHQRLSMPPEFPSRKKTMKAAATAAAVTPEIERKEQLTSLEDNDVICGRGICPRSHPGNCYYLRLITEFCDSEEYDNLSDNQKMEVAQSIVEKVHQVKGRFLQRGPKGDDNAWYEISNFKAIEKTNRQIKLILNKEQLSTSNKIDASKKTNDCEKNILAQALDEDQFKLDCPTKRSNLKRLCLLAPWDVKEAVKLIDIPPKPTMQELEANILNQNKKLKTLPSKPKNAGSAKSTGSSKRNLVSPTKLSIPPRLCKIEDYSNSSDEMRIDVDENKQHNEEGSSKVDTKAINSGEAEQNIAQEYSSMQIDGFFNGKSKQMMNINLVKPSPMSVGGNSATYSTKARRLFCAPEFNCFESTFPSALEGRQRRASATALSPFISKPLSFTDENSTNMTPLLRARSRSYPGMLDKLQNSQSIVLASLACKNECNIPEEDLAQINEASFTSISAIDPLPFYTSESNQFDTREIYCGPMN